MNIETAQTYLALFEPEFIEVDGCVYIKHAYENNIIPDDMDSVGKESTFNHEHVFDEFDHKAGLDGRNGFWYDTSHPDFELAWQLACAVGRHWSCLLKEQFPKHEFRVYCTKYDSPVVRFHAVRDNEPNWMDDSGAGDGVVIYRSGCL